ncbi:MAG: hypothetical protein ABEJ99_02875 [Candidatus Nanohaloarchaea archaeon]
MEYDEFKSVFGNVAVAEEHVEREPGSEMDRILQNFSQDEIVETMMFDDVLSMELDRDSVYPQIIFKTLTEKKRLFFQQNEDFEGCYRTAKKKWRIYRQRNP